MAKTEVLPPVLQSHGVATQPVVNKVSAGVESS
jgi:hypothetical protein